MPFLVGGCKEGLSERLAQKEGLGELECTEWWQQWLGQALLIMVERSVVLVQCTFGSIVATTNDSTEFFRAFKASDVRGH